MRWMWIDRIIELKPRERLVAIKNISMAEEVLHDHFAAKGSRPAMPIFPACFIVEGMAQTAGILVGHASEFQEKVILAKVNRFELLKDATAGMTMRYTATIKHMDASGASCSGTIERLDPASIGIASPTLPTSAPPAEQIGSIELMFSHIDQNMAGTAFPEENFVFSDSFKTLLRMSGIQTSL